MSNFDYMVEHVAADLLVMLVEKRGMTFGEAVDTLYSSDTYSKLKNAKTGLYFQSPKYVYTYLDNEINTGVMA